LILLPFNSVPRERFFEIVERHGVAVTAVRGGIRLSHDAKKFLEIWPLTEDDAFIYPDHVERVAEALKIDLNEFFPDRPDMS
jgi:hypothetical protein